MAKAKATHTGSCQACGSTQKLPGGKLSLHGYTVNWGCFNGMCPGAHHDPFEVSCALIQQFIENAKVSLESTEKEIKKLEELPGPEVTKAWKHEYVTREKTVWGSTGRYVWNQVEVKATLRKSESDDYTWLNFSYVDYEGKERKIDLYGDYDKSLAEAIQYMNSQYIKSVLAPRAKQLKSYIDWQTNRVNNWKPGELQPVKD